LANRRGQQKNSKRNKISVDYMVKRPYTVIAAVLGVDYGAVDGQAAEGAQVY
jgi:hypothetical protein